MPRTGWDQDLGSDASSLSTPLHCLGRAGTGSWGTCDSGSPGPLGPSAVPSLSNGVTLGLRGRDRKQWAGQQQCPWPPLLLVCNASPLCPLGLHSPRVPCTCVRPRRAGHARGGGREVVQCLCGQADPPRSHGEGKQGHPPLNIPKGRAVRCWWTGRHAWMADHTSRVGTVRAFP